MLNAKNKKKHKNGELRCQVLNAHMLYVTYLCCCLQRWRRWPHSVRGSAPARLHHLNTRLHTHVHNVMMRAGGSVDGLSFYLVWRQKLTVMLDNKKKKEEINTSRVNFRHFWWPHDLYTQLCFTTQLVTCCCSNTTSKTYTDGSLKYNETHPHLCKNTSNTDAQLCHDT